MPLTILQYITPSRLAGAEYFFLRVVAHLAQKGHRVIVVTKRDTPLRAEVEKLLPLGVELHAWHTHGKLDPQTLSRLRNLIRDEHVDLINTHLTTASWQGALAGKLTGVPVVAVVHATDRKTWFQHADRLIAVSGGVKDALIEQGLPEDKIEVLYHGIDLSRYVAPLSPGDAKVRLGLPYDAKTVGVAASLIPRKGHRFLLEALRQVEAKIGPVHALFAGEGELESDLKAQVHDLGLSDRVHFLGFRRDVPEVLCAMDIFALPSLKEGLSIAVMEAQALEKPVVVTNIAGMPEVVRDGQTGLLVPPGDVCALAHALETLWSNPEYGHSLGHAARDFLEKNFDQGRCLDTMEAYFRRVVAEWHAAGGGFTPVPAFAGDGTLATSPARRVENGAAPAYAMPSATLDVAGTSLPNLPPAPEPRRLTILEYITPSRIGGAERYFLRLVAYLASVGHRVIIVTKRDTPLRAEVERMIENGCQLELHAWHTHGKVDPVTLRKLGNLIRSEQVDLINTHLTTASWLGSLAGRNTDVPVVARVPATERSHFYSFADHLIAVSHGVRQHLLDHGVPAPKVAVYFNGIDLELNRATLTPTAAKMRLGLPLDARTVGVAASLIMRKGHRFLLEAVAQIEAQTGPLDLLFAGEGDQETVLREQAQNIGLKSRVHFLGFRRDILEVLCAMDVFVLPSLKEGLSNAVMEAMALERPVVVTNIAGMPEIVHDGKTGLLVEPGDVQGLADALSRLFADPDLARRLGVQGRAFLEAHFDQKRCLDEVEDYLQRVVADAASRAAAEPAMAHTQHA